jgi:hypothetical protein
VLLSILAVSALFFAVNVVLGIVLRLQHRMAVVVGVNALGAAVIILTALSPVCRSLVGFGWAWLAGQVVMALAYTWATRQFMFGRR